MRANPVAVFTERIQRIPSGVRISLFFLFVTWRLLSVSILGVPSTDSLHYLERSQDLRRFGFVNQGFKQIGYPLFIRAMSEVGDLFDFGAVFSTALAQRVILFAALGSLFWALRWWSLPVVLMATSPSVVAVTNMLVTESITIPLLLAACGLGIGAAVTRPSDSRRVWIVQVLALFCLITMAAMMKIQFAALVPFGLAMVMARSQAPVPARKMILAASVMLLPIPVLIVGQSFENRTEYGELTPVSETAHAQYWGAVVRTFQSHPDLLRSPAVREFYPGSGSTMQWLFDLQDREPSHARRLAAVEEYVDGLFAAVGTSTVRERAQSITDAFGGGRLVDAELAIERALRLDLETFDQVTSRRYPGAPRVENPDGSSPTAVITIGPLSMPMRSILPSLTFLFGWPTQLVMLVSFLLAVRLRNWMCLSLIGFHVAVSISLGYYYIDLRRYLLGNVLVLYVVLTTLAMLSWQRRAWQDAREPLGQADDGLAADVTAGAPQ